MFNFVPNILKILIISLFKTIYYEDQTNSTLGCSVVCICLCSHYLAGY